MDRRRAVDHPGGTARGLARRREVPFHVAATTVLHALKQTTPSVPLPETVNLTSPHPSALREQAVDGVTGLEGVFNGPASNEYAR